MKTILAQLAVKAAMSFITSLMDKGLVKQVQELVLAAFSLNVETGEERKQAVWKELEDIKGIIGESVAATAPWLINALIELTVGSVKITEEK